jgi:metal-responsive CopG/Arc/MetJ family transcriptional regulator
VVQVDLPWEASMETTHAEQKADAKSLRTSVSFPRELHDTLEQIAKAKKVSLAWIVRDAAERYVSDQWPLLERQRNANP